ncbi:MAG: aldo/keto reductase [Polyangia bacterium]
MKKPKPVFSVEKTVELNDGHRMPTLGYGVWQIPDADAEKCVAEALRVGYRSIDTARIYDNERGVGRAIAKSGVPREALFVTTKLWNEDQGFDGTLRAFDASLQRLALEYLDLYLIHWPSPSRGLYLESWKALVRLRKEGRVRSIGVSNFGIDHLQTIIDGTQQLPAVNQIELHPRFAQRPARQRHEAFGIVTEAWSPLGQGQEKTLGDATLVEIAAKHRRSVAQVILRWHLQHGHVVIPKSATPARIAENFAIYDFSLDDEDMKRIDGLDDDKGRIGSDPATATF